MKIEFAGDLPSFPESPVRNSQAAGIGRVAALGDLVAWNNLGRNIVFAACTDGDLRPLCAFEETAFPGEDGPSQYDLDVHALVALPQADLVLSLNHLGTVVAFRASALRAPRTDRRAHPAARLSFAADVERAVAVQGRLIASRPSASGGGLIVSREVASALGGTRLDAEPALEWIGRVTALSASPWSDLLAVGAGQRVSLFPLTGGRPGPARWQVEVPFLATFLEWSEERDGPRLWVAGSDPGRGGGDEEWDLLGGGGLSALRAEDGCAACSIRFPCDLAFGNGGVALCLVPGAVCGLDRRGGLHAFSRRDGRAIGGAEPLLPASPTGGQSLGIAHAAAVPGGVLCGFNRAGYRLFLYRRRGRTA